MDTLQLEIVQRLTRIETIAEQLSADISAWRADTTDQERRLSVLERFNTKLVATVGALSGILAIVGGVAAKAGILVTLFGSK